MDNSIYVVKVRLTRAEAAVLRAEARNRDMGVEVYATSVVVEHLNKRPPEDLLGYAIESTAHTVNEHSERIAQLESIVSELVQTLDRVVKRSIVTHEEMQQLREMLLEPVQREVTTPYWKHYAAQRKSQFEQGMY